MLAAYLGVTYITHITQGFLRTFLRFMFFFWLWGFSIVMRRPFFPCRVHFLQLISLLKVYSFLDLTPQDPKLAGYIVGIAVVLREGVR